MNVLLDGNVLIAVVAVRGFCLRDKISG